MEAPKCKICGERHYGVCRAAPIPHIKTVKRMAVAELPDGRVVLAHPEHPVVILDKKTAKSMFDRTAYQREYMRRRRAKAKQR